MQRGIALKPGIVSKLAIALTLTGLYVLSCGASSPVDVPILTDAAGSDGSCLLVHRVVDVVAAPGSGAPTIKDTGEQLVWPKGFRGRRAGLQVEVLDPNGNVVLTTGASYWICPTYESGLSGKAWVIAMVKPCPDCKLEYRTD
jgi:hypothetical protein